MTFWSVSFSSNEYSIKAKISAALSFFQFNPVIASLFVDSFVVVSSSLSLNSVQEDLVNQMVKDLADQIFNATVANW